MPAQTIPLPGDEHFNILVAARHGPMLVNRHDQYIGASFRKYGEFSPGETALFRQLLGPGMTVIEVGANIGAHTIELSRLVGPTGVVLTFEPQRIVFQTLCANLALNGCTNVLARPVAIGAAPGDIHVPVLDPGKPNNFGGLSLLGTRQGEIVPLLTLDGFAVPTCHLLKLDLEGMEVEALRGGAALVRRHRPAMYVENDRSERAAELVSLLLSWDYRLYWHTPPLFPGADNFNGDAENIFGDILSLNLLCLARERNITVKGLREITG